MIPKAILREVELKGTADDPDYLDIGRLDYIVTCFSLQAFPKIQTEGYYINPFSILKGSLDGEHWFYAFDIFSNNYDWMDSDYYYNDYLHYPLTFLRVPFDKLKERGYAGKLSMRLDLTNRRN